MTLWVAALLVLSAMPGLQARALAWGRTGVPCYKQLVTAAVTSDLPGMAEHARHTAAMGQAEGANAGESDEPLCAAPQCCIAGGGVLLIPAFVKPSDLCSPGPKLAAAGDLLADGLSQSRPQRPPRTFDIAAVPA